MIFKLPHYGSLNICGTDAKKFLQGQLTCNLDHLALNQSIMGAHCNPKGRIISLFYCLYHNDTYSLIMPREMISIAEAALKKYAPFFKVICINTSDDYQITGVTTDEIKHIEAPQNLIIPVSSKLAINITPKRCDHHAEISNAWEMQLINEKIPVITPDTSQAFLPHELNLESFNAIAFDKGCYTGQEIIARMHYRSDVKYSLYAASVETETTVQTGFDICVSPDQTKIIGRVVNVVATSPKHYQLLITLKEPVIPAHPLYLNNENRAVLSLNI